MLSSRTLWVFKIVPLKKRFAWDRSSASTTRWWECRSTLRNLRISPWSKWYALRSRTAFSRENMKKLRNARCREWIWSIGLTKRTTGESKSRMKSAVSSTKRPSGSKSCNTLTNFSLLPAASTRLHLLMTLINYSRWVLRRGVPKASAEYW